MCSKQDCPSGKCMYWLCFPPRRIGRKPLLDCSWAISLWIFYNTQVWISFLCPFYSPFLHAGTGLWQFLCKVLLGSLKVGRGFCLMDHQLTYLPKVRFSFYWYISTIRNVLGLRETHTWLCICDIYFKRLLFSNRFNFFFCYKIVLKFWKLIFLVGFIFIILWYSSISSGIFLSPPPSPLFQLPPILLQ